MATSNDKPYIFLGFRDSTWVSTGTEISKKKAKEKTNAKILSDTKIIPCSDSKLVEHTVDQPREPGGPYGERLT